ncbi:MAG: hypothetical protein QGH83_10860 [Candidatus Pacebacteria bacterium]|nr:hypothetical protein [Candidatus Paceibacterota bacterium]
MSRECSQNNLNNKGYMTCEEMVKAILEKRRKKEIENYVEEVLEGMTEMEITGPSIETLEGRQLNYGVNVG